MELVEWTKIFLKQRDLLKREIASITETKTGLVVQTKQGVERIILVDTLLSHDQADTIVCLNNKTNVEALIKEWEYYAAQETLLIVFANPKTNDKMLLKPHHHHKIADEESLAQGIRAMSDAISKN